MEQLIVCRAVDLFAVGVLSVLSWVISSRRLKKLLIIQGQGPWGYHACVYNVFKIMFTNLINYLNTASIVC